MSRKEANYKIIEILKSNADKKHFNIVGMDLKDYGSLSLIKSMIDDHLRFIQIVWILNLNKTSEDRFNEESEITLKRLENV